MIWRKLAVSAAVSCTMSTNTVLTQRMDQQCAQGAFFSFFRDVCDFTSYIVLTSSPRHSVEVVARIGPLKWFRKKMSNRYCQLSHLLTPHRHPPRVIVSSVSHARRYHYHSDLGRPHHYVHRWDKGWCWNSQSHQVCYAVGKFGRRRTPSAGCNIQTSRGETSDGAI